MENPFQISEDNIKVLTESYKNWQDKDEREKKWQGVREIVQQNFFDIEKLKSLSDDEYYENLRNYLNSLDGIFPNHGENRVKNTRDEVTELFTYINDYEGDPFELAEEIIEGDKRLKYYARSFWAPILNAKYPDELPNWNNKTENCLFRMGFEFEQNLSFAEKYRSISEVFKYLVSLDNDMNFDDVDHLMHYGTAIEEGNQLINELREITPTLNKFLRQSHTSDLRTKDYPSNYPNKIKGYNFGVSFGTGSPAKIPWMGFNKSDEGPLVGLFVTYLYFKEQNKLALVFGVREEQNYYVTWPKEVTEEYEMIGDLIPDAYRYKDSYVYKIYEIKDEEIQASKEEVESDLNDALNIYSEIDQEIEESETKLNDSKYTKEKALRDLFIEENEFDSIINALEYKKNIILQGPPGVGKTFYAKRIAYYLIKKEDESQVEMVQFHQSYSYEDFIQGYRPTDDGKFVLKDGTFYQFSEKAKNNPEKKFVLIIDEINRGNLSKIFGELMMLIESDKRGEKNGIYLSYQEELDKKFYIPENLYIIGTMNTADRSIAMVDYALRRRFLFLNLEPKFNDKFESYLKDKGVPKDVVEKIVTGITRLNKEIADSKESQLGKGFCIGHSFFTPTKDVKDPEDWYQNVIDNEIAPLLEEYFYDNEEKYEEMVNRLR